jgi:hypothetical protein
MFRRIRAWLARARPQRAPSAVLAEEERSSGEEAVATAEGVAAEATPSRMNRLKTDRL